MFLSKIFIRANKYIFKINKQFESTDLFIYYKHYDNVVVKK